MKVSMIEKILEAAMITFLKNGFSTVTTDEFSSGLGISKKTLYKYFETKEKLIEAVITKVTTTIRAKVEEIAQNETLPPLERLEFLGQQVSEQGYKVSTNFLRDLQKFRPDLIQKIKLFRAEVIRKNITYLIREGQKEGSIRKEIDPELAVDMFLAVLDTIMIPDYLIHSPHTPQTAFNQIFEITLHGISNHKGKLK